MFLAVERVDCPCLIAFRRKSARASVSDGVGKELGDVFHLAGSRLPVRQVTSSPLLFSSFQGKQCSLQMWPRFSDLQFGSFEFKPVCPVFAAKLHKSFG